MQREETFFLYELLKYPYFRGIKTIQVKTIKVDAMRANIQTKQRVSTLVLLLACACTGAFAQQDSTKVAERDGQELQL